MQHLCYFNMHHYLQQLHSSYIAIYIKSYAHQKYNYFVSAVNKVIFYVHTYYFSHHKKGIWLLSSYIGRKGQILTFKERILINENWIEIGEDLLLNSIHS